MKISMGHSVLSEAHRYGIIHSANNFERDSIFVALTEHGMNLCEIVLLKLPRELTGDEVAYWELFAEHPQLSRLPSQFVYTLYLAYSSGYTREIELYHDLNTLCYYFHYY